MCSEVEEEGSIGVYKYYQTSPSAEYVIDNFHCTDLGADATAQTPSVKGLYDCTYGFTGGNTCFTAFASEVGAVELQFCGSDIGFYKEDTTDRLVGVVSKLTEEVSGSVCDREFGPTEASVVCRTMQHGNFGMYVKGLDSNDYIIQDIACAGTEEAIRKCAYETTTSTLNESDNTCQSFDGETYCVGIASTGPVCTSRAGTSSACTQPAGGCTLTGPKAVKWQACFERAEEFVLPTFDMFFPQEVANMRKQILYVRGENADGTGNDVYGPLCHTELTFPMTECKAICHYFGRWSPGDANPNCTVGQPLASGEVYVGTNFICQSTTDFSTCQWDGDMTLCYGGGGRAVKISCFG